MACDQVSETGRLTRESKAIWRKQRLRMRSQARRRPLTDGQIYSKHVGN